MLNNIIYKFGKYIRYLPDSIIFGKTFNSAKLLQDEYLKSDDKIGFVEEYQYNSLRTLLSVANRVKYYKNNEYSLNIDSFNNIPFVNKSIMNNDISQFIDTKNGAVFGSTGGTSGKPFGFYINKNRRGKEWFWMTDNWSRVGFDRNVSYRGVLRNHILPNNLPYIKNTFLREYYFSNYNTTDSYLEKVVTYINNYRIEFIHAYPSAAHRLAKYLLNNNQTIPSVKALLLFRKGDPSDLAEKVNTLIRDKDFSEQIGKRARNEYMEKYTLDHNYKYLIDIYGELLNH